MTTIRADHKRGYLPVKADEAAMVILHDLAKPAGAPELPLIPVPEPDRAGTDRASRRSRVALSQRYRRLRWCIPPVRS